MTKVLHPFSIFSWKIKVTINPFFWLIILGAIITGQFIEIITLFGIVIIHELGHVFAAKSYNWEIHEIQLLPFGGMAKLEQKSDSIWEEFIVNLAGPLQNLIMILFAWFFRELHLWSEEWAIFFIHANALIAAFNLIPISPLDGSKLLKASFYTLFPYRRAVLSSIFISIIFIVFLLLFSSGFLIGTKPNMNGIILSIFFIYTNLNEVKNFPYQYWHFLLHKVSNSPRRNIIGTPIIVHQDIKVMDALKLLHKNKYHLFYIFSDEGEIKKIIPEEKILKLITNKKGVNIPLKRV